MFRHKPNLCVLLVAASIIGRGASPSDALCVEANGSIRLERLNALCCLRAAGGAGHRNIPHSAGMALEDSSSSDQCMDVSISDAAECSTTSALQFGATPALGDRAPLLSQFAVLHVVSEIDQVGLNVTSSTLQTVFLRC